MKINNRTENRLRIIKETLRIARINATLEVTYDLFHTRAKSCVILTHVGKDKKISKRQITIPNH